MYRDLKGVIDTAYMDGKLEGMAEGIQEGKLDVARALKNHGVAMDIIIHTTGLSREEIERL